MDNWIDSKLDNLVTALHPCGKCPASDAVPNRGKVIDVLRQLVALLFPGCHGVGPLTDGDPAGAVVRDNLRAAAQALADQCARAFAYAGGKSGDDCRRAGEEAAEALFDALPEVRDMLAEDIVAAYEGDPAAQSTMEVVMSYPGLLAIAVHRLAHILYKRKVPLIPRAMSEYAHSRTGIDIHPGATIGSSSTTARALSSARHASSAATSSFTKA